MRLSHESTLPARPGRSPQVSCCLVPEGNDRRLQALGRDPGHNKDAAVGDAGGEPANRDAVVADGRAFGARGARPADLVGVVGIIFTRFSSSASQSLISRLPRLQ